MVEQKSAAPASQSTPEKKLLEIIENPTAASAAVGKSEAVRRIAKAKPFDFKGLSGKAKALFSPKALLNLDFAKINVVLLVSALAMMVYVGVNVVSYQQSSQKKIDFSLEGTLNSSVKTASLFQEALPILSNDYLDAIIRKIEGRDLFKPFDSQKKGSSAGGPGRQMDLVKNFRLVGVSLADNPKDSYAMIEDTNAKVTYFLKQDETIQGLKVADIQSDRVVFSYQDQQVELR